MKYALRALALTTGFTLTISCHGNPPPAVKMSSTRSAPGVATTSASVDYSELRDVLAGLARAHSQKTELAFWTSTPMKPVEPPFKAFFSNMGQQQKELLDMLQGWAKKHEMNLTFAYTPDLEGQAKIMEDRQDKEARAEGEVDFQRNMVIQMFMDYEWQISQIQALLPKVTDPELKAYLQKSLKVHEEGSKALQAMLRNYHYTGR